MLSFLVSAIRLGMTFLLGSTGETITEKVGHLNLGTPGVMCVGAACGCFTEYLYLSETGPYANPVLAVLIPIVAAFLGSAIMGLLFCFLTVSLRVNQNVTGLALTTFGVGVSDYIISQTGLAYQRGSKFFNAYLPVADDLGWFGELFLSHGFLIYFAIVIALLTTFVFNRTKIGLNLRAVGEAPATADAAGINVSEYKYIATCIGCGISGLGGLSFIMNYLNGNWEYCIDAIGWLAIALVIFTVWKPNLAIIGSIVFGALYIASTYIKGFSIHANELLKMLPYVVTIIVLLFTSIKNQKKNQPPKSLGLSYFREER